MHRLIQSDRAPDAGGGKHTQRSRNYSCFVRKDVAKKIFGQYHIKPARIHDQMHCAGVDVNMLQRHARIFPSYRVNDFAPQLRGFKHVGLIDRSYFLPPSERSPECDVGDAFNFGPRIAHGVESAGGRSFRKHSTGLTKIKATKKLTYN